MKLQYCTAAWLPLLSCCDAVRRPCAAPSCYCTTALGYRNAVRRLHVIAMLYYGLAPCTRLLRCCKASLSGALLLHYCTRSLQCSLASSRRCNTVLRPGFHSSAVAMLYGVFVRRLSSIPLAYLVGAARFDIAFLFHANPVQLFALTPFV